MDKTANGRSAYVLCRKIIVAISLFEIFMGSIVAGLQLSKRREPFNHLFYCTWLLLCYPSNNSIEVWPVGVWKNGDIDFTT